jgi:predicted O-methyltransferase YrrM
VKLNKKGEVVNPIMTQERDVSLQHPVSKVKDSKWAKDPKPYTVYPWKKETMHGSVEAHYFYTRASELGDGNYANLGVFRGFSTFCFAKGLESINGKGKVYGVDLYNFLDPEELITLYTELGVDGYLEICKGYTHEWPSRLKDIKFKFIFIDADHHYETCKQDFELWHPLLEDDGQIAFHDTDERCVNKVICELGSEWEQVDHVFKTKSFKRSKDLIADFPKYGENK